ncbi:MFS transporter [Kribbella lupini]|uniref:MFS transporter n=2 Tax=Kribbella lupini TaxID=291602 RepID=A0ABN2ADP5_9ACTN
MGVTVVVAALPRMLADLQGSPTQAGLLVPAYAVGFGGLLLLGARLGDARGPRRVLLAGLAVFALGSVLCAVAPAVSWLVAGRLLQGVAAAISIPNALVLLIGATEPGRSRNRALAAWNATGGLAGASGLLVGGLVTDSLGWRVIFWATLAATAVLALAIVRLVGPADARTATSLNAGSVVLQVVSVSALVAAANAFGSSWLAAGLLAVLAIALVPALVVRERSTASPLIPPGIWRRHGTAGGVIGSFGITATTSTFVVITTLWFQDARGLGPGAAGLMILPFSFAVVLGAALAARLVKRGARLVLVVGLILIGLGALGVVLEPEIPVTVVALVLSGFGNGIGAVAAYTLGTDVPAEEQASAAGLLNTAAQLGTAVMVALGVGIATAVGPGVDHTSGWLTVAATAAAVTAATLATRRRTAAAPPAADSAAPPTTAPATPPDADSEAAVPGCRRR